MKDILKIILDSKNNYITLTNRLSDPLMWILTVYKKKFLFKKKVSSYWFNGESDAIKHSDEIIKSISL